MPDQTVRSLLEAIAGLWQDYVIVGLIAMLTGLIGHIHRMRQHKRTFSLLSAGADVAASGVVGIITYVLCVETGVSPTMGAAAAGIAGHMGARLMWRLERMLERRMGLGD